MVFPSWCLAHEQGHSSIPMEQPSALILDDEGELLCFLLSEDHENLMESSNDSASIDVLDGNGESMCPPYGLCLNTPALLADDQCGNPSSNEDSNTCGSGDPNEWSFPSWCLADEQAHSSISMEESMEEAGFLILVDVGELLCLSLCDYITCSANEGDSSWAF